VTNSGKAEIFNGRKERGQPPSRAHPRKLPSGGADRLHLFAHSLRSRAHEHGAVDIEVSDHRFLLMVAAVLSAAFFTAAFASPVAF
jgi:hypothetical protein